MAQLVGAPVWACVVRNVRDPRPVLPMIFISTIYLIMYDSLNNLISSQHKPLPNEIRGGGGGVSHLLFVRK